jgi:hypothetical protein
VLDAFNNPPPPPQRKPRKAQAHAEEGAVSSAEPLPKRQGRPREAKAREQAQAALAQQTTPAPMPQAMPFPPFLCGPDGQLLPCLLPLLPHLGAVSPTDLPLVRAAVGPRR